MKRLALGCAMSALSAMASWGDDVAFLVANESYAFDQQVENADFILQARAGLEESGFEVITAEDASAEALADILAQIDGETDGSGRVLVALTGHAVHSGDLGWFLGSDAETPDLARVGFAGISLDLLLQILARAPGQAVLLLGVNNAQQVPLAPLQARLGDLSIPQGVTVIQGSARAVSDFARLRLAEPGLSLPEALRGMRGLTASGFLAPGLAFLDHASDAAPQPARPAPQVDPRDRAFWDATREIGTEAAYRVYIDRFPQGAFVSQAQTALRDLADAPRRQAESDEQSLRLSREERRQIQRALTLLGFDTRGIDGIFGRGTRAAIASWQRDNGATQTGYVNQAMRERLALQAERRSAELEEEARLRRLETERRDRAYWRATGAQGDEAGLRAYLERYPDGLFAEVAQARLAPFEAERRADAAAQDRADWEAAERVDTLAAYRGYLDANPQGAFVEQARALVAEREFEARNADALEAARRNEARLNLNGTTRRLVEDRLSKLGLKPGRVDGEFDDSTRRALRRYQDSRRLQKTGYLNQATLVRLLADSILR